MNEHGWRGLALAGAMLLETAGPADAAPATAVVAVDRCAQEAPSPHAAALRDALARKEGQRVLSREETANALGGAPRGSLEQAERLLGSARFDVFGQSELARAERALTAVIADLEHLRPSDAAWADLRDARTLLGYLYFRQDRKEDAKAPLFRVLAVEPDHPPSEDLYPPSFRAFVDGLRGEVARASTARLKVTTHPAGRPVFVGGRNVGPSPVSVPLPPGTWRVEADFGTGGGVPREVAVEESATVDLRQDFEGRIFLGKGPCLDTDGTRAGRLSGLVRLAALLDVEQVIGVREEEPSAHERFVVATVIAADTGEETREGRVKLEGGVASAATWARLADFLFTGEALPPVQAAFGGRVEAPVSSAPAPAEAVSRPAAPAAGGPGPVVYAAGGAGLVGLGLGTFFALGAQGTDGELRAISSEGAFSEGDRARVDALVAQRDQQRTLGLVFGAVGVAGVATAAVLYLLDGDPPASGEAASLTFTGQGVRVRF